MRLKIWDGPVRVFHWSVALLVALAWWTAHHDQMGLHKTLGYFLAGLLIFRVWWGFFGGSTARFAGFVRSPNAVLRYGRGLLKSGAAKSEIGHNPMGGWSVMGLLGLLTAVVGFGLFTVDVDGEESGPLADRISFDLGRSAAHWHHLLFNVLLGLIALHLAAIAFYAVIKKDDLITPMITGAKSGVSDEGGIRPAAMWRLWLGGAIAAIAAWWLARGLR